MNRLGSILLVTGCILGQTQLRAQQVPEQPVLAPMEQSCELSQKVQEMGRQLLDREPAPFSLEWLREEVDPIRRERRELLQAMNLQAQKSLGKTPVKDYKRDVNKDVGLWRISLGNTSANNWSPFPDRALDARIITFPMRRDSRADKRTDQMKALDKLRQPHK